MGFTDIRVPHDENARRRDGVPVHKVDGKVLMSRAEFRSGVLIFGVARTLYI
jgi:hypothetical protein